MILTKNEFLKVYGGDSIEYRYMLLDRMRSDCEYVINACEHTKTALKFLWASYNPEAHIAYMRYLWDSLTEKPEWLTKAKINEYEKILKAF